MSNEEQSAPARDPTLPGNDKAQPTGDNAVEEDPDSPCPLGVEVCIPKGEVPEPVINQS